MLYLRKKFSVPAAPATISQEDWDQIFAQKCHRCEKVQRSYPCEHCGAYACLLGNPLPTKSPPAAPNPAPIPEPAGPTFKKPPCCRCGVELEKDDYAMAADLITNIPRFYCNPCFEKDGYKSADTVIREHEAHKKRPACPICEMSCCVEKMDGGWLCDTCGTCFEGNSK